MKRRLAVAILACVMPLVSGCALLLLGGGAAAGAGAAIFYAGKVEQTLAAPLAETHEAAASTLKSFGLPVIEDKADKLTGHLESEYADGKHVWIDLEALGHTHTRVTVRVGVIGDKGRALDILSGMRDRLGQ